MDAKEKTDLMIARIKEDCRFFGLEESYIQALEKDVLITKQSNDDYWFSCNDGQGYVLTFWERGQCNFGINSLSEEGFRFLFQRHIVLHDFKDLSKSEDFMAKAYPLFGETREYQEAQDDLARRRTLRQE